MVKITDRMNNDTQTIGELWESLAEFCVNRVKDNNSPTYKGSYPLEIRHMQMTSLKCLIKAIE